MASSIYFSFLIISIGGVFVSQSGAVERIQIVSTILHKYDTGMRPQEPKGVADQVAHKLSLNRIVDLDVHKQVLTLDVWEMFFWKDERLSWFSDGPSKIFLEPKRLWMPDFVLYNSAEPPTAKFETSLHVQQNGDITYVPAYVTKTYCDVSELVRVGDHVTCKIIIGSWLYEDKEVDIQMWNVTDPHMDTNNFEDTNLNWGLDSTHVEKVFESYPCCPGEYGKLHYTIKLVKKNRPCL